MARLFFKVFYMTFLWMLLLANLVIFFDLSNIFNAYTDVVNLDLSNRYFGVSDLINALKDINNLPAGSVVSSVGSFQKMVFEFGLSQVGDIKSSFIQMQSSFVSGSNVLDWLKGIFYAISNMYLLAFTAITYIFGALVLVFYYLLLFISLVFTILKMIGGTYSSQVPNTHLLDGALFNIGNLITPLLTAV